jgi:hypothetical protein
MRPEIYFRKFNSKVGSKANPATGRGGLYGCETSRLEHFEDSRLTDGGEVVSLTRLSRFTPRKIDAHLF